MRVLICAGVCSGISAPAVAWEGLGWKWAFESEIDKFPSAVLKHHRPDVPNYGDITKFKEWPDETIDLLVGGTPCQSFSVAGLRGGLDDPRGNLALVFLALAGRYQPRWIVWENVPGVLSSNKGRDFGAFLGALVELGYGFAYRVLDAQWFGVAQRRRRVFVVGYFGDWRRAAAVLFESESLRGDSAPSREAGEGIAPSLAARTGGGGGLGTDAECDGALIPFAFGGNRTSGPVDCATAVNAHGGPHGRLDFESETFITPLVPVAYNITPSNSNKDYNARPAIAFTQNQRDEVREVPVAGALAADPGVKQQTYLAFQSSQSGVRIADTHATLDANNGSRRHSGVVESRSVRRLTPRECERLQGFPDDYTAIPWRNKPADKCPDGPRYKALGNSMAVPAVRWIGERIALHEEIA